jgi:Flp pilus assembly protein TadG
MIKLGKIFKYLMKCQKGVVAIEMAMIGPFMMLLYFGLLDMTTFMTENRKTIAISGSIGDLISQNRKSIVKSELTDFLKIGKLIMKPGTDDRVRIVVTVYRRTGTGPSATANPVWSQNNGKGPACVNAVPKSEILALMELNNDVVVTQTCTKIRLYSGKLLAFYRPDKSDFDVENFVMVRPRTSLTLECYATSATTTGPSTC